MSIWADIYRRSNGLQEKKEDIKPVYFKLNHIETFQPNEKVIFNEGTSCECVGEYITCGRIDKCPIFELTEGNKEDVNNCIIYYDKNGLRCYTYTYIVRPISYEYLG